MKIVRALDKKKAHGCDEISDRTIKICDEAPVNEPLSLIYKDCIDKGIFPNIWEKSNIVPVYKKGNKQVVDNCRRISFLPICSKILDKILFNLLHKFLEEKKSV